MFPFLSLLTFLPLVGGIVLLLIPKKQTTAIKWTALSVAVLELALVLVLALLYAQSTTSSFASAFQFNELLAWIPGIGINYSLGVDGISVLLIVLTALLTVTSVAASFRVDKKLKNYMAFMLFLETGIIGVFVATNLFVFYVFWEIMLIPAYFLLGGWGGERRVYAALKFVLYTSVGSLMMLAGIIGIGYVHQMTSGGGYTLEIADLLNSKIDVNTQTWLFLAFGLAFAVKTPLVPFHSWLPDAYGEAPAPVTAMLAGAMSKTGAYGLLRLCIPLFPQAAQNLSTFISILAIVGILYCAWMALIQNDIKRLLAYSSISHLSMIVLGIFSFNVYGVEGALLQMFNHGVTTAALFLLAGYLEKRLGTRKISEMGGYAFKLPVLAVVMLIASLSALGLPGLNSFAGEFLVLLGIFRQSAVFGILATAVVVPAAWYMLRFFLGIMTGPRSASAPRKQNLIDIELHEFLAVTPLLALMFYIGLQPAPLLFLVENSVLSAMQVLGSVFLK